MYYLNTFRQKQSGMKLSFLSLFNILLLTCLSTSKTKGQERIVPYTPGQWVPKVWVSETPASCPFKQSVQFSAIAFTRKYVSYTDADTFIPHGPVMVICTADGQMGKYTLRAVSLAAEQRGVPEMQKLKGMIR